MIEQRELLEQLPYWDSLSESERAQVGACTFTRHFSTGELLFSVGCECLGMTLVLQGEVRAYIVSLEGREITLFPLRAGDTCVLSASCAISQITFETAMIAQEETDLLIVPANLYEQLMAENIHVRCFTYELLAQRTSAIMNVLQQMIFLHLDQRVAAYLLEEMKRADSATLHITQEKLAESINSARETVSRQLARFARDGLVEVHRGTIRVLDQRKLLELVEQ